MVVFMTSKGLDNLHKSLEKHRTEDERVCLKRNAVLDSTGNRVNFIYACTGPKHFGVAMVRFHTEQIIYF